jgi:hypothetical protein
MKINFASFLIIFALAFAVFSCKSEEPNPAKPMSCRIDAAGWNADLSTTARLQGGNIIILGTNALSTITLSVPAKVGVYDLKAVGTTSTLTLVQLPTATFVSNVCVSNPDGTIEITALDLTTNLVSGKFSGKVCPVSSLSAAKIITEGAINNVKITQ